MCRQFVMGFIIIVSLYLIKTQHTEGIAMSGVKEINISINNRVFSLDLGLEDEALIEAIISSLAEHVKKGFSIKLRLAYVTSLSDSTKIISKVISNNVQMQEWKEEVRQLLSIIRKGTYA